jgi:hypothetical protein
MSLIVARKEALSIIIVSDTKLSMPKERQGDRGDKIGLPSSGVIKTAIINSDTAISFAGGEDHAEEALQRIKDSTSLSDILAILLQAHLESCEATDFIVAVGGLAPTLYEVKNSAFCEVEAAWIGSWNAFSLFQAFMQGTVKSERSNFITIEPSWAAGAPSFALLPKAMDYVIDSEQIPEVGGFRVSVVLTKDGFQYVSYAHTYFSERPITVKVPKGVKSFTFPITHGTATDGGYSVNFFRSTDVRHAGLHILQGNFGIIYKRTTGGLMRPEIVPNIDEVDFVDYAEDNFGIGPSMVTQSRGQKCLAAGDESFARKNFEAALAWYEKALRKLRGKERAVFCYRKAVTLANLKRYPEVPMMLKEAIDMDADYNKPCYELLDKIRRYAHRG